MVDNKAFSAAIVDLRNQKKLNFNAIIKKHIIDRTTLRYYFKKKKLFYLGHGNAICGIY